MKHDKINIALTKRDRRLFEILKRVRCLSQRQIEALLKPYGGTYRNRLCRLSRARYLRKLTYSHRGGVYGVIWTGGWQLYGEVKSFKARNLFEAEHQLGLNQIYLDLISALPRIESLLDWQDGIYSPIQFGSKMIRPDAILNLLAQNLTLYIEYDRSTKKLRLLDEQLRQYRDYFLSPYSPKQAMVWFVTKSNQRAQLISGLIEKSQHDVLCGGRIKVMPNSEVLERIKRLIGATGFQNDSTANKPPSTTNLSEIMVPLLAVRPFCEEAVGMFYHQRLRLPASYRAAAAVLYPDRKVI